MPIFKRFKNTRPLTNYLFKNGKAAHFVYGQKNDSYDTDVESEIQELNAEVKARNPHIYIDPTDFEFDSDAPSPFEVMKSKLREELLAEIRAEQAAATDPKNDMGNTVQGKTIMQNSAGVSAAGAESTSADAAPVNATSEAAANTAKAAPSAAAAAILAKLK